VLPWGEFFKTRPGPNLRLQKSWRLCSGGASANFAPTVGASFSVGANFAFKKTVLWHF
jgi:hypothetical protein